MYLLPIQQQIFDHWARSCEAGLGFLGRVSEFGTETLDRSLRLGLHGLPPLPGGAADPSVAAHTVPAAAARPALVPVPRPSGRIALVTGGIGGIGTAICQVLAARGHRVVASYIPAEAEFARTWEKEHTAQGLEIAECDVRDFDSCQRSVAEIERRLGPIDILVNCAGITRDAMLRKMDEQMWHDVLDTNLDSVFNVTRNVVEGMCTRGYGRIVNISSVNGQKGQFGQTNYSASKAGMIGFSRALAREVAGLGITVNSVCPGYVATRMVMAVPEEVRQSIVAKIPVGRLGAPEEIAKAVAFLADEDSGYITGTDLSVNGGLYMS
jgi:acetoacetyl-CoA reductase